MADCSCHPLRIGNQPVDPNGPKNLDEACPQHGQGTRYYHDLMVKHREESLELRVKHALTLKLIKLQSCCLDNDTDFKRVVAAAAETTLQLIDLDRRSRS